MHCAIHRGAGQPVRDVVVVCPQEINKKTHNGEDGSHRRYLMFDFRAVEKIPDHLQSSGGDFIIQSPNTLVGGHVLYIGWNELAPPDVLFLASNRKISICILAAFPLDQRFGLLHFDNGLL